MKFCYFLTRNLYPYLLPSIMSILDHNPQTQTIYIFAEDDELPYELPPQCKVINISGQTIFNAVSPNWRNYFAWICLMRVTTSRLLPDEDKIIQLDIDTIICDDLTELWNIDLGGNLIGMAAEVWGVYRPYGNTYYNAGVALINLKQVREEHTDEALIRFLNTTRVPYIDQDAWNVVAMGRVYDLPQRFNESKVTSESDNPAIVHYASIREHWIPGVHRGEYYDRYRKYQR